MITPQASALKGLLQRQSVAALGTLHAGQPFVSMVPFAVLPDGSAIVIHVSHLASHTRDMMESPNVSLMVMAPATPELSPQELPRVTIQGQAVACGASDPAYAQAKAVYVKRFSQSSAMFEFADFQLVMIQPTSARYVGGFASATTLTSDELANALRSEQ